MINNCSGLLLLVALLSYNNRCTTNNSCTCCNNACNCNSCNCGCNNNATSLGMDAGMLCLLLAFITCGYSSVSST